MAINFPITPGGFVLNPITYASPDIKYLQLLNSKKAAQAKAAAAKKKASTGTTKPFKATLGRLDWIENQRQTLQTRISQVIQEYGQDNIEMAMQDPRVQQYRSELEGLVTPVQLSVYQREKELVDQIQKKINEGKVQSNYHIGLFHQTGQLLTNQDYANVLETTSDIEKMLQFGNTLSNITYTEAIKELKQNVALQSWMKTESGTVSKYIADAYAQYVQYGKVDYSKLQPDHRNSNNRLNRELIRHAGAIDKRIAEGLEQGFLAMLERQGYTNYVEGAKFRTADGKEVSVTTDAKRYNIMWDKSGINYKLVIDGGELPALRDKNGRPTPMYYKLFENYLENVFKDLVNSQIQESDIYTYGHGPIDTKSETKSSKVKSKIKNYNPADWVPTTANEAVRFNLNDLGKRLDKYFEDNAQGAEMIKKYLEQKGWESLDDAKASIQNLRELDNYLKNNGYDGFLEFATMSNNFTHAAYSNKNILSASAVQNDTMYKIGSDLMGYDTKKGIIPITQWGVVPAVRIGGLWFDQNSFPEGTLYKTEKEFVDNVVGPSVSTDVNGRIHFKSGELPTDEEINSFIERITNYYNGNADYTIVRDASNRSYDAMVLANRGKLLIPVEDFEDWVKNDAFYVGVPDLKISEDELVEQAKNYNIKIDDRSIEEWSKKRGLKVTITGQNKSSGADEKGVSLEHWKVEDANGHIIEGKDAKTWLISEMIEEKENNLSIQDEKVLGALQKKSAVYDGMSTRDFEYKYKNEEGVEETNEVEMSTEFYEMVNPKLVKVGDKSYIKINALGNFNMIFNNQTIEQGLEKQRKDNLRKLYEKEVKKIQSGKVNENAKQYIQNQLNQENK